MTVTVTNAQQQTEVNVSRITRVARSAVRRLRIRGSGTMAITFIDSRRMRTLNKRFLRHDRPTDVLSFRYDGEPVVGEILIDPSQARAYAARHKIAYAEELSRYVVHGLLHWMGHEDRTRAHQVHMRKMEDRVLTFCGADSTGLASRDGSLFRNRVRGRKKEPSRNWK